MNDADVAAAIAFREKSLKERAQADTAVQAHDYVDDEAEADERTPFLKRRRPSKADTDSNLRGLSIDPLSTAHAFDETLRDKLREDVKRKRARLDAIEDEEDEEQVGPSTRATLATERLLERNFHAPAGKKIAVPVRIEPKVYFATERTFLVSERPPSFPVPTITINFHASTHILAFHRRNGSISQSTSARLQQRYLTLFLLKILLGSSVRGCSPSRRSRQSHTPP